MSADDIWRILWAWRERIRDLRRDVRLKTFFIVKNVGAAAGATLDHPHSQILGLPFVAARAGARDRRRHVIPLRDVALCVLRSDRAKRRPTASESFRATMMRWRWRRLRRVCRSRCGCCRGALRGVRGGGRRRAARDRGTATRRHAAARRDARVAAVLVDAAHVSGGGGKHAAFHWHLEILPRLTPVSGLAWDGGVVINPVPPEEAAQVLRAQRLCEGQRWRPMRRDRGLPRLRRFATLRLLHVMSGNNSVVECDLAKVEVAGSNPVSRSSLRSHPCGCAIAFSGFNPGC